MTNHDHTKPGPELPAAPTNLDDIRHLAVLPVYSAEGPNLAGLLGCSRWVAYSDVRRGRWPAVRVGRSVRVVVPGLLKALEGGQPLEGNSASA